jgi:UPF0755 protein
VSALGTRGRRRLVSGVAGLAGIALVFTVAPPVQGPTLRLVVPAGATLGQVVDSLAARGIVRGAGAFEVYARARGAAPRIKAGHYALPAASSWSSVVRRLTRGEVLTEPMTVPEGFTLAQIVPRIAEISGVPEEAVAAILEDPQLASSLDVPGPGLEGYLFPDTYFFASGVPVRNVVASMVDRYRAVWTPERRARLEGVGLTEQEAVTLASIVQAEARREEEMPQIAGVYRNRLERGWLLQADPTVLYALGGYRARLLFAAIDSVADHPYNTYASPGLPPGPIGSPGEAAIDATLSPTGDYLFFVAWPDGTHVFTRSLAEHNQAVDAARRARSDGADD